MVLKRENGLLQSGFLKMYIDRFISILDAAILIILRTNDVWADTRVSRCQLSNKHYEMPNSSPIPTLSNSELYVYIFAFVSTYLIRINSNIYH